MWFFSYSHSKFDETLEFQTDKIFWCVYLVIDEQNLKFLQFSLNTCNSLKLKGFKWSKNINFEKTFLYNIIANKVTKEFYDISAIFITKKMLVYV